MPKTASSVRIANTELLDCLRLMPDAAIVTVGDELLCGDVPDTNGTWLAGELERHAVAAYELVYAALGA
jgi:hypothetical protein